MIFRHVHVFPNWQHDMAVAKRFPMVQFLPQKTKSIFGHTGQASSEIWVIQIPCIDLLERRIGNLDDCRNRVIGVSDI